MRARQAKQLVNLMPDSKLMILEDAGHVPHLHAPQLIKRLIDNEMVTHTDAERYTTV